MPRSRRHAFPSVRMTDRTAHAIAAEALALRVSHPHAPVAGVLDLVMRGRDCRLIDFGDLADPPHPFALLIAEAFDTVMTPREWKGMITRCDAGQRAGLIGVWRSQVWDLFLRRYCTLA